MPKAKIDIPRIGPFVEVRITYSCRGCVHHSSESVRVQGDSDINSYCNEPDLLKRRNTGLDVWQTPKWCVFRSE